MGTSQSVLLGKCVVLLAKFVMRQAEWSAGSDLSLGAHFCRDLSSVDDTAAEVAACNPLNVMSRTKAK
jgi:hypothetical protein